MIQPANVHEVLGRHQLADGYPIVMDLEKSHGSWIHDAASGNEYLDFFTCFASWPIGYNHPRMQEPDFVSRITKAGLNNPANSDIYTGMMAGFVEAFATRVSPEGYPYHFWVQGGALAVENAMKVAFDWKAHKVGVDKVNDGWDLSILHLRQAFHGRSGYTMSVTNTVHDKVALFPKFCWPRVHNPAIEFDLDGGIANDIEAEEAKSIAEIEEAFASPKQHVAAILLEPMQGEGGDNHFRPEYFQRLRELCDKHDALLIFDEVQTGFFGSGKPWLWQTKGVKPDVVAFGKKTQVCGLYANTRVDDVPENVFHKSSRINSTWGGNLVDMVRSHQFIEIILGDNLQDNVAARGEEFLGGLRSLAKDKGHISNVRGVGSLAAFTLETPEKRDALLKSLWDHKLMALASGPQSIRARLPLTVSKEEIAQALERIADSMPAMASV